MRFGRLVVAATTVLSFAVAKPALAQYTNGTQAYGNDANGKPTNAAGFFEGNVTVFGAPNEQNKIGGFPKVGVQLDGSVFRAQGTAGPCSGSVGLLNGTAYANASLGVDTTGPAGGSTYRGTQPAPSGSVNAPSRNGRANGGGVGPGGMVQCKAGVEVNAITLQGSCDTPIGTISGNVKGLGAQAECGCTGCFAEAYWAKAGAEYTTPAIGGCGLKVSGTAGAEVMAGVAIGAEAKGTVGGRVKVGPVGVTLALNVEEFDPGKMGECIADAARAVADTAVAVATRAYEVGATVVNAVGDGLNAAGNAIGSGARAVGNFFGGLFGGGSSRPTPRPTYPYYGGPFTPGVGVPRGAFTAATANTVYGGLSNGTLPGTAGNGNAGTASGAGTAGALGR